MRNIDPNKILQVFSAAKLYVSMSDGPLDTLDSRGNPFQLLSLKVRTGNTKADDVENERITIDMFFTELIRRAKLVSDRHVIVEWRTWPEFDTVVGNTSVYARFTIYPQEN